MQTNSNRAPPVNRKGMCIKSFDYSYIPRFFPSEEERAWMQSLALVSTFENHLNCTRRVIKNEDLGLKSVFTVSYETRCLGYC